MRIQPLSALVGAASLGVALLTLSAFQVPVGSSPTRQLVSTLDLTIDGPVQVAGVPAPSQMMRIDEGSVFIVPTGKVFVLTALGTKANNGGSTSFLVDGVELLRASASAPVETTMYPVPPGLKVDADASITLTNGIGLGAAWGYLADA